MAGRRWFISDTHFFHGNILKFVDKKGNLLRPEFSDYEKMNEVMIERWNSVVRPEDSIVHLGDIGFCGATKLYDLMSQLNGSRKILIKGNHDNLSMDAYRAVFSDVWSVHRLNHQKIIFSHFPIHPDSIPRNGINVHGHIHRASVMKEKYGVKVPDERYLNICVELTNYTPVSMEWIIEQCDKQREEAYYNE